MKGAFGSKLRQLAARFDIRRFVGGVVIAAGAYVAIAYLHGLGDVSEGSFHGGALDKILQLIADAPLYYALPLLVYAIWKGLVPTERLRKEDWPIGVLGIVLSFFTVTGMALAKADGLEVLFGSAAHVVLGLFSWIALSVIVCTVIKPLFDYLESKGAREFASHMVSDSDANTKGEGVLPRACDYGHPLFFRLLPLLFLVAWLPFIIINLPGAVSVDMANMISQFEGLRAVSTHHPLFASGVYGVVYTFGKLIGGSDFAGIVGTVVMQTACMMAAATFQVWVLRCFGPRFRYIVATVAFFALYPFFGIFSEWVVKDSLFASAFVFYLSLSALYCLRPGAFSSSPRWMAALLIAAVLVSLLRNNGFYVVLLSLPLLLVLHRGAGFAGVARKAAPLVVAIAVVPIANAALAQALDASYGSVREALSLPLQQTARYVRDHGGDVQPWERDAVAAVLDYDSLAELYNPNRSDPVKETFKAEGSLGDYFRAWASMGMRHPLTYLSATGANTYGYWLSLAGGLPFPQETGMYVDPQGNLSKKHEWAQLFPAEWREVLDFYVEAWRKVPLVGFLMCAGTYTWLLLGESAFLIWRGRPRYLVLLVPCFVLLLTCIAGPLNGSMRYALGFVATAPLCMVASLHFATASRLVPSKRKRKGIGRHAAI